jgi:hypothetical protein
MTEYILNYKLVSKWGLDRGEVGGYENSQIFESRKEAEEFSQKYPTAAQYRGMSYSDQAKYQDSDKFFSYTRPIQERVEIFDKANLLPDTNSNIVTVTGYPICFKLEGKFRNSKNIMSQGYFCHTAESLAEAWKAMMSEAVVEGKIYAVYEK